MPSDSFALDVSLSKTPPPGADSRRGAFFGLDRTLLRGSSLFVVVQDLHRRAFCGTGQVLRVAWWQLARGGHGPEAPPRVERVADAALRLVRGRERAEVEALASEIVDERILPHVDPGMRRLIERQLASGVLTFVVTAGPVELATVVAQRLGMTGGLGTRAELDDRQRYSGGLAGSLLHGRAKAMEVEAQAAALGIDLSASFAYSASVNDVPLLQLVGTAEVVNPDRRLRRLADDRGWPVHELRRRRPDLCRPAAAPAAQRLAALGLSSPVHPAPAPGRRRSTNHFLTEDPEALVRELEASGRFRRDTRLGALFHRGKISLRETAPTHSLHITVGDGNRISAHVDRYSPLAVKQPEHGARYALHRVAAHNLAGMAGDLVRLIPRRRRR